MGKFIISLSLISLLLLLAGSLLIPSSPFMWLASTSITYNVIRAILAVILLALLVTVPPRHIVLRTLVGMSAVVTLCWALIAISHSHMLILDGLSLISASLSMGMVALEVGQDVSYVDLEVLRLKRGLPPIPRH